jgi:16S rRNA (cytosine967-C5)-methyltransferase
LRVNSLKISTEDLLPDIRDFSETAVRTFFAPDGIGNCHSAANLFRSRLFQDGLCAIQDEAAQLIALLVDPKPGERVLDGCAGLGGKSGHMAQLMRNQGKIIAVDRSNERLERLVLEMRRLGISIVQPLALSLEKASSQKDLRVPFDRILIDAPCSGLGVIRRNPDIKWSPLKRNLDRYQLIQSRLLEAAAPLVKPDGILVYAVCSAEPEETETVVSGFLKNHPDFAISARSESLQGARFEPLFMESCLRTYPRHLEMDGFFGVRLRRIK